jgi:hypothetical protein
VVTVDVGNSICLVTVHRLYFLLGLDLDLIPTIIICNYHIRIFFLLCNRGKNRVDDVVKAVDIMLKLSDGVLCLL